MPHKRACPGLGDPPGLRGRGGGAGRAWCRRLGVGEQVVSAGEQLAGDRDGGDLLPAAFADGGVGGGELRGALGGLRGLIEDPPQPRRALPGDAWRTLRSEPRTVGVSPAQLASLRALGNRVMSPISASMTRAVNSPTPGSVRSTLTRGSAFARWCNSPSSRSITGARASMDARQSVTISRDTGGRSSSDSQPRPGPVQ
jgi:hypothetical protein